MAALDFPSTPATNQEYAANGGTWRYNGTAWVNVANGFQLVFTGFNGGTASTSTFDLSLDLGGA